MSDHLTDDFVTRPAGSVSQSAVNGGSPAGRPQPELQTLEFEQLLQQAKLAALAEFAAGAGHEINNPLGSILIASERLLRDETDPERRRLLATIGGQALRIRDMIGDLMLFANPPAPEPADLDLAEQLRSVAARFEETYRARGIQLRLTATSAVPICADHVQLAVVISELLRNAVDAVQDGGLISITTRAHKDAEGEWALFTVTDNGRGLNETERTHLFDPFFSGRQAGRGLGFGLSKAWRIVMQHGGKISVETPEHGGAMFTVLWPASSE